MFRDSSSCKEKTSGDTQLGMHYAQKYSHPDVNLDQLYHNAWWRTAEMFGKGNLFIRIQVFKPGCICKLFEERRHFRGGLRRPWEWCWGPRTAGRWGGSFGFGLLYWRNDLRRLHGKMHTQMRAAVLWVSLWYEDITCSYLFILLHYGGFLGYGNRPWLDFHQGLWFRVCCWSLFLLQLEKQITTLLPSIFTYYCKSLHQTSRMT